MPKDEKQQLIFSENLNRLVRDSGKTQKEIAEKIGVSPQTFNTWCQGIAIPRMGKIQALADYFGVGKSALLDERKENMNIDGRLDQYLELLHKDPRYRALLDSSSRLDSDALDTLVSFIEKLTPDE